jgi:flagellar FliL protein
MPDPSVDIVPDKKEEEVVLPKPKKSRKWPVVILSLILLTGAAVGGVIFLAPGVIPNSLNFWGTKAPGNKEKETERKSQGYIYSMDPFVVNLADQGRLRYLKIRMSIESQEMKVNEEYEKRLPQLRDTILTVLSSKSYGEISDSEGKRKLREEIILKLNRLLRGFQVKTVYFTEFMIQ